ncbi:hypothetical protein CR513_23550, partial [Mucuna pruriens]
MDVSNGFFMLRFDLEVDLLDTRFLDAKDNIRHDIGLGVCFPSLGIMFYDESVPFPIASTIGHSMKVNLNTLT